MAFRLKYTQYLVCTKSSFKILCFVIRDIMIDKTQDVYCRHSKQKAANTSLLPDIVEDLLILCIIAVAQRIMFSSALGRISKICRVSSIDSINRCYCIRCVSPSSKLNVLALSSPVPFPHAHPPCTPTMHNLNAPILFLLIYRF